MTEIHKFTSELMKIKDDQLRSFVAEALKLAPKYFWNITSSSSGKHHPPDERTTGGRVLHTKRVARLAMEMASALAIGEYESDILIASALLHDIVVNGPDDTPMQRNWRLHDVGVRVHLEPFRTMISPQQWDDLFRSCEAHMGQWGSSPTLRANPGELGYLLHLADLIASRNWVIVEPLSPSVLARMSLDAKS